MNISFVSREPSLEDYWRGIILYGRNVASYKFALAKSLLDIRPQAGELLKLEDLAPVFAGYITDHLKLADKQGTSGSSRFLDACREYNSGTLTRHQLTDATMRYGFNNVIDAFHVVGQGEIPERFYIDERKQNKGIRLTDEFARLLEREQAMSLPLEVEARWRLVETAWELAVSRSLMSINFDGNTESLFAIDRSARRKSVTGSREALNGYQKGKCFYCITDINVNSESFLYPDVDHFFPHSLKQYEFGPTIDGVWNLVLSCQECNRGAGGKFDRVPGIRLLERLHKRNEFLISSHHPLGDTLIQQTGSTIEERAAFLNDFHNKARAVLIHQWEPVEKEDPPF